MHALMQTGGAGGWWCDVCDVCEVWCARERCTWRGATTGALHLLCFPRPGGRTPPTKSQAPVVGEFPAKSSQPKTKQEPHQHSDDSISREELKRERGDSAKSPAPAETRLHANSTQATRSTRPCMGMWMPHLSPEEVPCIRSPCPCLPQAHRIPLLPLPVPHNIHSPRPRPPLARIDPLTTSQPLAARHTHLLPLGSCTPLPLPPYPRRRRLCCRGCCHLLRERSLHRFW